MRCALEGDIWTITLNRPDRGNAIDVETAAGLADAVRERPGSSRAVLLSGAGPRFCVGGDVSAFADAEDPGAFVGALAAAWHIAVRELLACPVPVVLAVHGAVAGAAVGLLGACDIAVCGRPTTIRPAYASLGLSPDGGTSWLLSRTLGEQRAIALMLTNGSLDADQALAAGLVATVVDGPILAETASRLAQQLADGPVRAFVRTRQLVRLASGRTLEEHLDDEGRLIAESANDVEGREGVRAFAERRQPTFRDV